MGVTGRAVTLLATCLAAHLLAAPIFRDTRDGSSARVGAGRPAEWAGAEGGVLSGCRHGAAEAYMHCLEGEVAPRMSFLLVHDLAEHSGALGGLAAALWGACAERGVLCNVYGIDLAGHGLTWEREGGRGEAGMARWVEQVARGAEFVRERTEHSAVFLFGLGLGGEVAFQATQTTEAVAGTISNGLLLPSEVPPPRPSAVWIKGWVGEALELLLQGANVFTPTFVNFERIYDKITCDGAVKGATSDCHWAPDKELYAERMLDPLNKWHHPFSTIRSLATHTPPSPAKANTHPTLVLAGGMDHVLPASHVTACFDLIGGPKFLRVDPTGGHQMVRGEGAAGAAKLFVDWGSRVLDGLLGSVEQVLPQVGVGGGGEEKPRGSAPKASPPPPPPSPPPPPPAVQEEPEIHVPEGHVATEGGHVPEGHVPEGQAAGGHMPEGHM